ncbi:hypothetical protein [Sphingorhabdus lutea]|nr:hypothetical protein [Sphingorhabdus lutea]
MNADMPIYYDEYSSEQVANEIRFNFILLNHINFSLYLHLEASMGKEQA